MTILEAMQARHSVRSYLDRPIEAEKAAALRQLIQQINEETGLHIQLQTDEPDGFAGVMAHYGSFAGVRNYIVMAGPKNRDRAIGYHGERVVLAAQMLGLNTCWVALTYNKRRAHYTLADGEKLYVVISLGYGETQGKPHRSKAASEISDLTADAPAWYRAGIEAVLLAPTAVNQQKFFFSRNGDTVTAKAGSGFYTEMDLGIAQYHFDAAAGTGHFAERV